MHKIQRFDGTVINAARSRLLRNNAFAVGHKINHPPVNVLPNLMPCSYDFPRFDDGSVLSMDDREFDRLQRAIARISKFFASKDSIMLNEPRLNSRVADFIPNSYWKKPSLFHDILVEDDVQVRSLVMIALRDILDGEELFVNYRYNPELSELPEWYTPVNTDEDKSRWGYS